MITRIKSYVLDNIQVTCTCMDFKYRRAHKDIHSRDRWCKHLIMLFKEHPELTPSLGGAYPTVARTAIKCSDGKTRYPRAVFDSYVKDISALLKKRSDIVKKFEFTGSYRRGAQLVSDIDVLLVLHEGKKIDEIYDFLEEFHAFERLWRGDKKASYKADGEIQIDFKCVPENSWAFALLHYTGPKDYNIECRRTAIRKGLKLNEYGLFDSKTDNQVGGFHSEEEIQMYLGLPTLNPVQRQSKCSYSVL